MKFKLIAVSLMFMAFCGFSWKDGIDELIRYIRKPADVAVDLSKKAVSASIDIASEASHHAKSAVSASADAAADLYSHVTKR